MALYLPIRAVSRSQRIRIGQQTVTPTTTTYVDITDTQIRRALNHHQAIGAVIVVGGLTASSTEGAVVTGLTVTGEGTPGQSVAVAAGEVVDRGTGLYKAVAAVATLNASAADASKPRVDLVQVNYVTGAVSYKAGVAATTGAVAPAPDANNIAVATVARAANDNTITTGDVTDVRPRP